MAADYQKLLLGTNDDNLHIIMKDCNISQAAQDQLIQRLKDWCRLQPHFPNVAIDNNFILRILATNSYSFEKAKVKIDNLFLARAEMPEFFSNRNPSSTECLNVYETVDWAIMPQLTDQHYRVSIMSIRDCHPDLFNCETTYKVMFMITDIKMMYETALGELMVWDCSNTKLGHVVKMTPMLTKKILFLIQKCYGAKIKGIHILNAASYTNSVVNVGKMVLKKKIADRIFVHKSLDDFHKHISPKYLPKELGGFDMSLSEVSSMWYKSLQTKELMGTLSNLDRLKSDKAKRPISSENPIDDLLGITGSFRKLESSDEVNQLFDGIRISNTSRIQVEDIERSISFPECKNKMSITELLECENYKHQIPIQDLFNLSQKTIDDSIEVLKSWFKTQPHFPKVELSYLLYWRYVIAANGSIEKSKTKIENFFTVRSLAREYFYDENITGEEIETCSSMIHFTVMPVMMDNLERLSIVKLKDIHPDKFDMMAIIKLMMIMCDLRFHYDICAGENMIWDCTDIKLGHILKVNPMFLKKVAFILQKCYPTKVKGIYIVNAPSFANGVVNLLRKLLKKKIADRMQVFDNIEDLHTKISPKYLPKDLKGTGKSYAEITGPWIKLMHTQEIKDTFKFLGTLKTDESKRPSASKYANEFMGPEGSFRSLDID
ncbi:uncharacterized protein LOC143911003 [Arctopsyche grandis]|uniref:uncharacterized protein LOC143911003 n=1 Tax=Arctopsyche grandis TaxID=121162 RepID=UPI00406D9B8D